MLNSRVGLTLLILLVFAVNWGETWLEQRVQPGGAPITPVAYQFASAMQGLEGRLGLDRFENHDATDSVSVYGYSVAYFFVFPLLCLTAAVVLIRRPEIDGYRVLCLAVAVDYLVSLIFFLAMPVPERWAFPGSGAILLSDLWTSDLIAWIRPVSGLDNCFPSSHTSLTVIVMLVWQEYQLRFFGAVVCFGATIILATFVLGVHWVPDVIAGVAVGWLSVSVARHLAFTGTSIQPLRRAG